MNYTIFNNELRNYRSYQREVSNIREQIDVLMYQLRGVKGIRYDKEMGSWNPGALERYRLDLLDKIEEKEQELDFTMLAIQTFERKLNRLPKNVKKICLQIADGKTYEQIANDIGYSVGGLWLMIKREVEKV